MIANGTCCSLNAAGLFARMTGARILHFAPERHLRQLIKRAAPSQYVLADLYPESSEVVRMDLQALPYQDGQFDFVLANRVLEHVQNDMQALREIFRVLVPGGHAILQTPYAQGLSRKFEDSAIQHGQGCLQAYGQEDHRRLYRADFAVRVEASGLRQKVSTHAALLPGTDATRLGVNPDEPVPLLERPVAT